MAETNHTPIIMPELSCIPIRLSPRQCLSFSKCTLLPGVVLVPYKGDLRQIIDAMNSKGKLAELLSDFAPTHLICVDSEDYINGLSGRLRQEGSELPDQMFVEDRSIAKQVAMALLLTGPITFEYCGSYSMTRRSGKSGNGWRCSGWGNMSIHIGGTVKTNHWLPLGMVRTRNIGRDRLRRMMGKLDRYYRSGMWWHDRLGMALSYFWGAVCTYHPEQTFMSLTTAMESLLNTQPMEITHILAERVAVLVGTNRDSRIATYRQVKSLYKTRSKIVHGQVYPKKGRIHGGTLFVGPKSTNVPREDLQSILDLTLALFRKVFALPDFLSVLQTKRSEDKTSRAIDEFFLNRLL